VRELALIEQSDKELARDIEQVCGLLGRQLLADRDHGDCITAGENLDDSFQ
jgi:hypothetical protein